MSAASNSKATKNNSCSPYKDRVFIVAQSLSIVGLGLSFASSVGALVMGAIGFLLLQVAWCYKLNKCGLITAGVFCVLGGVADFIFGALLIVNYFSIAGIVCSIIGGALWITAGIMTLVFACGRRLQKQLARDEEDDDGVIHVVATPIQDNTTFSSASNYSSPKNPGSAAPTSGTPTAYVQRAPDEEAPSDAKPPSYAPPATAPGVDPNAVPTPGAHQMPHAGLFQKN